MTEGNTIKYEEFVKLPDGVISSGILTDSGDGINIDGTGKLLRYVIYKYSAQDWRIYCLRNDTVKGMHPEEAEKLILNTGTSVTNPKHIKRAFNCSKKVLDLYTI